MTAIERGKMIRKAREDARLTQQEVAKIAGVSRNAVSQWENGHTNQLHIGHAYLLALALDLDLADLVDEIPVSFKRRWYSEQPANIDALLPDETTEQAADVAYMWDRLEDDDPVKDLIWRALESAYKGKPVPTRKKT